MTYEKLDNLLSSSTTVRLIRAQNAPLILSFLNREFKGHNRIAISNTELVNRLSDYIEYVNYNVEEDGLDEEEEYEIEERAKRYLDIWTEQGYLRKFPDETGEHMHELTSDTEKSLQWVDQLQKKEFVGTESRFKDIFKKLRDLVENSTDDPVVKIKELEAKKKEIEEQIRQIKITQSVVTFNETQIKERFYEVNRIAKELLSDFKEVEANFKDIIRNIYEKQSDRNQTKGTIVGYALDALEELKQKDQGRSFYSFWQFLIADKSQEELKTLVEEVYGIMDRKNIEFEDDRFLRRIKTSLHAAGKKVIDSNKLLSAKLSKVLVERDMLERRKTIELIGEIRQLALAAVKAPPKDDKFVIIDDYPVINMIMARPLGEDPHETVIKAQPTDSGPIDLTQMDFETLFNQFSVNKTQLLNNIGEFLKEKNQVSLAEVVEKHPLEKGLSEVLTYMAIASQSNKHIISDKQSDILRLNGEETRLVKVPQVIYTK